MGKIYQETKIALLQMIDKFDDGYFRKKSRLYCDLL